MSLIQLYAPHNMVLYNMSSQHNAQTTNKQMGPIFPNNNQKLLSDSGSLHARSTPFWWGCVYRGERSAFDTVLPFPSFCLLKLVGTNVQGRQWVMLRVHDEKGEQSKAHICCAHKRRTSAKWRNKRGIRGEVWGDLNWKGKGCVGVCVCASVAFLMRWPHTMAELKVASPFEQE